MLCFWITVTHFVQWIKLTAYLQALFPAAHLDRYSRENITTKNCTGGETNTINPSSKKNCNNLQHVHLVGAKLHLLQVCAIAMANLKYLQHIL